MIQTTEYKCPIDKVNMGLTVRVPGVEVEHCWVCGGIYYDQGELEKRLGQPISMDSWESDNPPEPLSCPKCSKEMAGWKRGKMRIFFCSNCKGIWVPKMNKAKKILVSKNPKEIQIQNPLRPSSWKNRSNAIDYDDEIEPHHNLLTFLGFPYEYNEKASRFPIITMSLILINTLIYLLSRTNPIFFFNHFGFTPNTFSSTTFYTLFTYMFIHADIFHLVGNMYFLWVTGDNLEDKMGSSRFLFFYLTCGVLSILFYNIFARNSAIPNVGASGAISAMIGAYLVLFPNAKFLMIFFLYPIKISVMLLIPMWAMLQFLMSIGSPGSGVNHLAHLGGFLIGVLWILFVSKRIQWDTANPTV